MKITFDPDGSLRPVEKVPFLDWGDPELQHVIRSHFGEFAAERDGQVLVEIFIGPDGIRAVFRNE
ncbi:hypothetical protein LCGC14_0326070 [marine sediment metagenome]|uniref:Uncharacterized protein n=1 Tax=marine sediment metagenome TaxID=412755 RepID=A0A0F9W572_9ZZZZ